MTNNNTPLLEMRNIKKDFFGNQVLTDINFTLKAGEVLGLVGENGAGKSTLMKLLLKELEPTKGRIVVNDMDLGRMPRRYVPKYRRRLGVVFQDFRLLKDRTVFENVAFAQRVIGVPPRIIRETVPEMLRLVGLSSKYKAYPRQLSGGEQQRIAVARAIVNSPEVLFADEPTGNLDEATANEIIALLKLTAHELGKCVIVVTHSKHLAEEADEIIQIKDGDLMFHTESDN